MGLRLDPKFAAAHASRGMVYGRKGRHDAAIADYNEAIRLDPNDAAAYSNRGLAYDCQGRYDEAIADCRPGDSAGPEVGRGLLPPRHGLRAQGQPRQGDRRLHHGHPARSEESAKAHDSRRQGPFPKGRLRQGDRRLRRRHPAETPETPASYYNRGAVFAKLGDYVKAIAGFPRPCESIRNSRRRPIAPRPPSGTAAPPSGRKATMTRKLPTIPRRSGSTRKTPSPIATAEMPSGKTAGTPRRWPTRRGHPARPDPGPSLLRPGQRLRRQGPVRPGPRRLERGHPHRCPERPRRVLRRGKTYRNKGQYDQAIADCDNAIALDKTCRGLLQPGHGGLDKRQYDWAIFDCNEAIAIDPAYAAAYYGRGTAYEKMGDDRKAKLDFDHAQENSDSSRLRL